MEAQLCQRGSYSSSVSSNTSVYHDTFDRKTASEPERRMSQDTIYSCDSAATEQTTTSPREDKPTPMNEASSSTATLPCALGRSPPPRPPRRLRPPKVSTIEKPTDSDRKWPLPPYCYDPFEGYDDSNLSSGTNEACSRADSMFIDPGMVASEFLNFEKASSADVTKHGQHDQVSWSASASHSVSHHQPELLVSRLEKDRASQKGPPKLPIRSASLSSSDFSGPTTPPSNGEMKVGHARPGMLARNDWNAGPVEAPSVIGSAIKKLSTKAAAKPAAGKPDPHHHNRRRAGDQQRKEKTGSPTGTAQTLKSNVVHVVSRSNVAHTEISIDSELSAHHRGLRKQAYPPRVRYTDKSAHSLAAARPPSNTACHARRYSDEQYSYAPRLAFDHLRPSSLR